MNPELEQLRAALEAYLALGEDTPVAQEAMALMGAIDATEAPPEEGMIPEPPLDEEPLEEPVDDRPGVGVKSFGAANKTALPELRKRNRAKV